MTQATLGRFTSARRVLLIALLAAAPAGAVTFDYGTFAGTSVSFGGPNNTLCFGGVCETPIGGSATPLFTAPTVIGDQLLFFPSAFSASAAGTFGFGQVGSQLQLEIASNTVLDVIDKITIAEFGDANLAGIGTAGTGTFASMGGFVTVTEAGGVPIVPVIIPWGGVFTPSDTLLLPGDAGTTLWSATAVIDVASFVANATKLTVSYDNNLMAFSETGTSALIQKKVVSGPAIVITVPEPGTLILLCGGLLGVALNVRRRSAHC